MDERQVKLNSPSPLKSASINKIRTLAKELMEFIGAHQFPAAREKIAEIERLTPSGSELIFCSYMRGLIALKTHDIKECLEQFAKIIPRTPKSSAIVNNTEIYTLTQNLLAGLLYGLLKQLLLNHHGSPLPELLREYVTVELDEREVRGIVFNFTEKLSDETQLKILANLKNDADLKDKKFNEIEFSEFFLREEYFITAKISAPKLPWQKAAYLTRAFIESPYKPEQDYLTLFYYEHNGVTGTWDPVFDTQRYTFQQFYWGLQSMLANKLLSEEEYARLLGFLKQHIEQRPEEPNAPELVDKIERQILFFNPALNTENAMKGFFEAKLQKGPRLTAALKKATGESYAKNYFQTAWDLCWQSQGMKVAACFVFIPQLLLLTGALLFSTLYLPYKSRQWNKRDENSSRETEKTAFKKRALEKLENKDKKTHGKRQKFFRLPQPDNLQPLPDNDFPPLQLEGFNLGHPPATGIKAN